MASSSLLRFKGESAVLGRFRVAHGRVYRVVMLRGCGSFTVRVYDVESPQRFADCDYGDLAEFVSEWEAVE